MVDDDHDPAPVTETLNRRRAVRRLARAETAYVCSLLAFGALAVFAYSTPYFTWDLRIERAIQGLANPALSFVMSAISLFGNYAVPYAIAAVACLAFWFFSLRSEAVGLGLAAIGSGVINRTMKTVIDRPRPVSSLVSVLDADRGGASFPSGHVAFYVSFFGFLFFVAYALLPRGSWARRIALFVTGFLVLSVGLSRVYLGAHWPSDTIGAYLWSAVWLAVVLDLYRRWKANATFHRKQEAEVPEPTDTVGRSSNDPQQKAN